MVESEHGKFDLDSALSCESVYKVYDRAVILSNRGVRANYFVLALLYLGNYFGFKKNYKVFSAITNCQTQFDINIEPR